jgi:chromosome partitioning protein
MIVSVASFKGGVAKTTTAVHLAAYLAEKGRTVLIDGDPNRSATAWARRGELPCTVIDERQAAKLARDFEHSVIDTEARPDPDDLQALVSGCDQLVIPTTPDALSLDALMLTVRSLQQLGADNFRILLTVVPPKPNRDGEEARSMLAAARLPMFEHSVRRFSAFQKAALRGVPVFAISDPRAGEAWADYEAIAKELLK